MITKANTTRHNDWPTLAHFPLPAKALVTVIIATLALAMAGAMAQVIVHDIIPTFAVGKDEGLHLRGKMEPMPKSDTEAAVDSPSERGDLFSDASDDAVAETDEKLPFYATEQFVWTLKWTHIHLFGMNMIFMFLGGITLFLNIHKFQRTMMSDFFLKIFDGYPEIFDQCFILTIHMFADSGFRVLEDAVFDL